MYARSRLETLCIKLGKIRPNANIALPTGQLVHWYQWQSVFLFKFKSSYYSCYCPKWRAEDSLFRYTLKPMMGMTLTWFIPLKPLRSKGLQPHISTKLCFGRLSLSQPTWALASPSTVLLRDFLRSAYFSFPLGVLVQRLPRDVWPLPLSKRARSIPICGHFNVSVNRLLPCGLP